MSDLSTRSPMPLPDAGVTIRPGTLADVPFLDQLQRMHTKQVGWMPTKQFEGKIKLGHVLIAEMNGEPVGYCIGNDQYFKRDDVGIIYQMNVLPGRQRGLIGATLLKAQFERSAYGCKLYCCWCAQDIAANRFWEAMGFVPLAFRAGSEKKSRTHIFWQKRIRQDDVTTPWWFPSKTAGGAIREDRIVLPIPPGTHWSDAKPLIFPALPGEAVERVTATPVLPGSKPKRAVAKKADVVVVPPPPRPTLRRNGLVFDIPQPGEVLPETLPAVIVPPAVSKPAKAPRVKRVCDPRLVSAARELRDRWLEQVNGNGPGAMPLRGAEKYAVARLPGEAMTIEAVPMKLLAA